MNHPLLYLPSVENTNTWAREHLERFGDLGAVYTTSQTAGRGRRGHTWVNAAGQALYYSCVVQQPLVQPETLPLLSCLVTAKVLHGVYGIDCRIKWPNDLLLNGKKIVGILCESVCAPTPGGPRAVLCGIGINLAQPAEYFAAAGLPHATSLALEGLPVDPAADADALARTLTDFAFDRDLYAFEREGFGAVRPAYRAACVNLGRRVQYDGGCGVAVDVDEQGRLVVQEEGGGAVRVFTGEVHVTGIYGAL